MCKNEHVITSSNAKCFVNIRKCLNDVTFKLRQGIADTPRRAKSQKLNGKWKSEVFQLKWFYFDVCVG